MLTLITCPTCHHKFTVPEGSMGQRSTCPNCQSIFVAGKSVAESSGRVNGSSRRGLLERAGAEQPQPQVPLDKTMLGEVGAPIRYNCPRCKKPLESPASEAGTKKPCPSCGGRLQVPAAPPPAPASDPLNKTLLATAEATTPTPAPLTPSATAPMITPSAAQPPATPAGPLAGWRKYAAGGAAAAVLLFGVLYFVGRQNAATAELEKEKWLQAQKQELEKLKAEIEQKTVLLKQQQDMEAQQRRKWDEMLAQQEVRQRELDRERDRQKLLDDKKARDDAQALLEKKQRELDEERRQAAERQARSDREMKEKMDDLRRQVDNANNRQTTVIQTAPPPVHPWWYHRYYYPW
jgi:DNA-directed RNA polymerase subunit RPC12/RpoP